MKRGKNGKRGKAEHRKVMTGKGHKEEESEKQRENIRNWGKFINYKRETKKRKKKGRKRETNQERKRQTTTE